MINVSTHPSITKLHELIDDVPSYPVSAGEITSLAGRNKFPDEIVDFYRSFPPDQHFSDKDDLINRTELIELLETEQQPVEDTVHGAED